MRVIRLLSTTAAIVLISGGIAAAQGTKKDETPAPAPSAQQRAPAEKVAPPMAQHPAKARETTGQASPNAEQHQGGTTMDKDRHERGAKPQATDEKSQKSGEKAEMKNGTKANESTAAEKQGAKTRDNAEIKNGASGEKSAAGKTDKIEQRSTTGQGAAGAAKLSSEQRTKITTIFRSHKVAPVHLDVSIAVGTRIPEHVHFYPLPVEVVAIYPEWRGYDYILVGDEILVVDPRSHEIVAILEA